MVTHRDEGKHYNLKVNWFYGRHLNMARGQVRDIYPLLSDADKIVVDYYFSVLPGAQGQVRLAREQLKKGAGPYKRVIGEYLNEAIKRRLERDDGRRNTQPDQKSSHPKHNVISEPWYGAPLEEMPLEEMEDVNKSDNPEESR
jgi:hypothetical protein